MTLPSFVTLLCPACWGRLVFRQIATGAGGAIAAELVIPPHVLIRDQDEHLAGQGPTLYMQPDRLEQSCPAAGLHVSRIELEQLTDRAGYGWWQVEPLYRTPRPMTAP